MKLNLLKLTVSTLYEKVVVYEIESVKTNSDHTL